MINQAQIEFSLEKVCNAYRAKGCIVSYSDQNPNGYAIIEEADGWYKWVRYDGDASGSMTAKTRAIEYAKLDEQQRTECNAAASQRELLRRLNRIEEWLIDAGQMDVFLLDEPDASGWWS